MVYTKKTKSQICQQYKDIRFVEFTIKTDDYSSEFMCDKTGKLFRKMKSGFWKEIINKSNHCKGYNVILVNKKQFSRARIILYGIKNLDLYDKHYSVNYINNNRLDCNIDNLLIKNFKKISS